MGGNSPWRPVVCLRNKDEMKQVEEKEDCFILEFDPDEEFNLSQHSDNSPHSPDLQLLAQKGQIACRDFPHQRHLCVRFPFGKTPHEKHCQLCYCYVCDLPAPCKNWVGGTNSHCHALDDGIWRAMRKSIKQAITSPVKVASRRHRRHECVKFPFGTTSHDNHCELCNCYVCEKPAPCSMWTNEWLADSLLSGHCHAFSNDEWRSTRACYHELAEWLSHGSP